MYKQKYGQSKYRTKECWDYECCTLRRNFSDVITGCDVWSNFIFVHSLNEFGVFLLNEEDYSEADDVAKCLNKFDSPVRDVKLLEKDWDTCEVIVVLQSLKIFKFLLKQTDVLKFNFQQTHELEPVYKPISKTVVSFVSDRIVIGNQSIVARDFFQGEESTKLYFISQVDLSVREVEFHS